MTRGIQDERDLVRLLWNRGFAVLRAPASGASTRMPRPDIVAGNSERGIQFAIEVKTTHSENLYITRESLNQLVDFAKRFGCQSIVAVKFKGRGRSWLFLEPKQLAVTPGLNFKITLAEALQKGMDIKTLSKEGKQTKLLPEGGK
ncbi:MAG: Holliday junction resolvase Hjc [Candidatus Bathyarchaeota archaeon]